jgi:hypothetical protein
VSPTQTTPRKLVAASLLLALAGCGGGVSTDDRVAQANSTNIERLASLYTAYQSEHDWAGPPDEESFKKYVRAVDPNKLKRIGIDAAAGDSLFTSERDNQPFKIRYGVRGSAMGSSEPVIFEAAGAGGRRMVGFLDMTEREVDDAEYQSLWTKKAQPTAAQREQ